MWCEIRQVHKDTCITCSLSCVKTSSVLALRYLDLGWVLRAWVERRGKIDTVLGTWREKLPRSLEKPNEVFCHCQCDYPKQSIRKPTWPPACLRLKRQEWRCELYPEAAVDICVKQALFTEAERWPGSSYNLEVRVTSYRNLWLV